MPNFEVMQIPTLHLVGMCTTTSLVEQGVPALWQKFRPQAKEIVVKTVGFFNVSIYPAQMTMSSFTPTTPYVAWAAVATSKDLKTPAGMATLRIDSSTYVKVTYRGVAQHFGPFAARVYGELIPAAGYAVDNSRPHFEFLSEHYRPDDPEATEDFYVPVTKLE